MNIQPYQIDILISSLEMGVPLDSNIDFPNVVSELGGIPYALSNMEPVEQSAYLTLLIFRHMMSGG